jgi:hypothetical protein
MAAAPGQLLPADRGTRLGAQILDSLIFAAMVYLPFVVAMVASVGVASPTMLENDGAAGLRHRRVDRGRRLRGVVVAHDHIHEAQRTIDRQETGRHQGRARRRFPSVGGRIIWLRNILNGFISIVPLYGLLDSLFIFGESRQCLHDKIADTIVINA